MSFKLDDRSLKNLEKDLRAFKFKALPFVTKQTLNDMAFDGRKEMRRQIGRKMVERNKWTRGSVAVNKAKTLILRSQSSEFGSSEEYMVLQEYGGTERGKGGSALSIPTGYAAGQEGTRPRTRLPRKAHKMRNIKLTRLRQRGASKKQQNFLKVREAKKRGIRYIFMDLGRRKGVFRLLGSKHKPKVKMVADISHKVIRIPATPTMRPAANYAQRRSDEHYRKNMIYQLRRHRIFID